MTVAALPAEMRRSLLSVTTEGERKALLRWLAWAEGRRLRRGLASLGLADLDELGTRLSVAWPDWLPR